jgi:AbrB family looped-hinge helix DNA binding protein
VKITEKGQVTIPVGLRKKHGLQGRAEVQIIDHPAGILVVKAAKQVAGKLVLKALLGGGPVNGTTRGLLRLTRGA